MAQHNPSDSNGRFSACGPLLLPEDSQSSTGLEDLAHDLDMPLAFLSDGGAVRFANRAFAALIDKEGQSLSGMTPEQWMPGPAGAERAAAVAKVVESGKPLRASEVIRGRRFLLTLRPVERSRWGRGVLMILSTRAVSTDEARSLHAFEHKDLGRLAELTKREMEILSMIARGLSQKQIAEKLHRTLKTVEAHRASLGRKLGVRKNIQLVQLAVEAGLLDEGHPLVSKHRSEPAPAQR
jgi:DNA-binding CsgD family transcriptional regulator